MLFSQADEFASGLDKEAIWTVGVGSAHGSATEASTLLCGCRAGDSSTRRVHLNIHSATHKTW